MLGLTTHDRAQELSDEEILKRSQKEPWIYAVLLERYQEAFLRKARTVVRNELDAEEVVQDTFTKIYTNADKFEPQPGAKFSSWAYRILMNTAFTRYQKQIKEGERFMALDPEYETAVPDKSSRSSQYERTDAVERVLARLPEHFVYVLRRHYLERWPHQDIAAETGETVGTIKARIHRAKAAFRQESSEDEVTLLLLDS